MGRLQPLAKDGEVPEMAIRTASYNRSIVPNEPCPNLTHRRFRSYERVFKQSGPNPALRDRQQAATSNLLSQVPNNLRYIDLTDTTST